MMVVVMLKFATMMVVDHDHPLSRLTIGPDGEVYCRWAEFILIFIQIIIIVGKIIFA